MWNSIKGAVTHIGSDSFFLENRGLEWEMEASATTLSKLSRSGEPVRIYTYLQHKDELMKLYGFFTPSERSLFLNLVSVSGVGPKLALKMLSGMKTDELILSLENEDVANLCRIPGLGKKTAQKIILQLRGKLTGDDDVQNGNLENQELVDALIAMGFDKKSTLKVVNDLSGRTEFLNLDPEAREKEIMRKAIVSLSSTL